MLYRTLICDWSQEGVRYSVFSWHDALGQWASTCMRSDHCTPSRPLKYPHHSLSEAVIPPPFHPLPRGAFRVNVPLEVLRLTALMSLSELVITCFTTSRVQELICLRLPKLTTTLPPINGLVLCIQLCRVSRGDMFSRNHLLQRALVG